jgi:hypothetical protein
MDGRMKADKILSDDGQERRARQKPQPVAEPVEAAVPDLKEDAVDEIADEDPSRMADEKE